MFKTNLQEFLRTHKFTEKYFQKYGNYERNSAKIRDHGNLRE